MACKTCFSSIGEGQEVQCQSCSSTLHQDCAIKDGGTFCDVCYASGAKQEEQKVEHKPDFIRRSYIELYRSCPHAYYLQEVKGFAAPPNAYTQVGIDLHELFDKASHNPMYTMNEMFIEFWARWKKYPDTFFEDDQFREKMRQRALDSIQGFYNMQAYMPAKPWVTEEDIYFDVGVGLPQARITMDRLDLVDGMIDIIDYKTGNVLVGKKISSELQPPMYIRAVQQKYKYPVRKFHLHYLAEGKERVYHRIDDDNYVCTVRKREYHVNITEKMKEVQQIFSKIVGGKFNIPQDTKSMFFACKMCHHKTEGRCRGADEESWYQKGW